MTRRPTSSLTIHLPEFHAQQRQVIREARRNNIPVCGRQWGKTTMSQRLLIDPALKGIPTAYFAPTYKMLAQFWRDVRDLVAPIVAPGGKSEQEHRLELVTGGVIEMWSLDNPDAPRGRKFARAIIDEAALIPELTETINAVIRPTLMFFRGDLWILSTPRGLNDFYRLYAMAGEKEDWARWHFTSYDNPHLAAEEIDGLKESIPERTFRQEIMAEFIEDGGFFQGIDAAAVVQEPEDPEKHKDHTMIAAVDWALTTDFTVVAVGCKECGKVVDWDRFNQMDYTYQRARVASMYRKWGCQGLLPERNSIGEPNIEMLIGDGLYILRGPDNLPGFNTTATTKPQLIQGLAGAIEHGGFKVPVIAADELRSFEVMTMASGHLQFRAPNGQHDDWVMALALLWHALTSARPLILFGA